MIPLSVKIKKKSMVPLAPNVLVDYLRTNEGMDTLEGNTYVDYERRYLRRYEGTKVRR